MKLKDSKNWNLIYDGDSLMVWENTHSDTTVMVAEWEKKANGSWGWNTVVLYPIKYGVNNGI